MKIVDIGTSYEIDDDFYFRVLCGPFRTKEEADTFAALVALLEPEDEAPPPLGVNVSETINTADLFG